MAETQPRALVNVLVRAVLLHLDVLAGDLTEQQAVTQLIDAVRGNPGALKEALRRGHSHLKGNDPALALIRKAVAQLMHPARG
jgi:hypothetical protein